MPVSLHVYAFCKGLPPAVLVPGHAYSLAQHDSSAPPNLPIHPHIYVFAFEVHRTCTCTTCTVSYVGHLMCSSVSSCSKCLLASCHDIMPAELCSLHVNVVACVCTIVFAIDIASCNTNTCVSARHMNVGSLLFRFVCLEWLLCLCRNDHWSLLRCLVAMQLATAL
jgi:hypothetical protein